MNEFITRFCWFSLIDHFPIYGPSFSSVRKEKEFGLDSFCFYLTQRGSTQEEKPNFRWFSCAQAIFGHCMYNQMLLPLSRCLVILLKYQAGGHSLASIRITTIAQLQPV